MIYLKTIILIFITIGLLVSGVLMSYDGIKYWNTIYIFLPIMLIALLYIFFELVIKKRVDINLYNIKFHFGISLLFLIPSVLITLQNFDFNSLLQGDYAEIRAVYLDKLSGQEVSILEQVVPLLIIYPLAHLFYLVAQENGINYKMMVITASLLFIGQKTGGRQIIFQLFVAILVIKNGRIFPKTYQSVLFILFFILLASIVTIGRFSNPDVSKAQLLENITPAKINPFLKEPSNYPELQDLGIEIAFYFGQSVPAFCNEISNVDIGIFPKYLWGMQPFLERQLGKIGLLGVNQNERYERFLSLTDNSGFFPGTWGTGFLDIYFNLGILGGLLFFAFVAFLLFTCERNLKYTGEHKFRILRGYHVLFIITMFMAPAFFDTAIIFSYLFIFFNKPQ
jgi:hypothetical protein